MSRALAWRSSLQRLTVCAQAMHGVFSTVCQATSRTCIAGPPRQQGNSETGNSQGGDRLQRGFPERELTSPPGVLVPIPVSMKVEDLCTLSTRATGHQGCRIKF